MADWIYVDNSNIFIEGQRVSAVKTGMALDIWDALHNRILLHNTNKLGTCCQVNWAWAPVARPMVTRKTVDARRLPTRSGSAVVAAPWFGRYSSYRASCKLARL